MASRINHSDDSKSLHKGNRLIDEWGNSLSLKGNSLNKAKLQFAKIESGKKNLKGRSVESIVAAIIYVVTRQDNIPIKPHDIESATHVDIKEIKSAYKAIKEYVEHIPPLDAPRYCQNFCNKLKLPNDVSKAAFEIASNIKEKRYLDSKNPRTAAAVAIYMAT
mmetsp:Transcript_35380/g.31847  ORF Transcript_35380/g.31847 Transcript_35380/m.31847 type:complete len:163 (+) Transcript_35380:334-822(+)